MTRDLRWSRTTIRLVRNGLLGIDDGRGMRVRVRSGTVWLTQHDDPRDVVLREGESFTIERAGRTVVQALDPSELRIDGGPQPHPSLLTRTLIRGA